jgi:hypothetical protein
MELASQNEKRKREHIPDPVIHVYKPPAHYHPDAWSGGGDDGYTT